MNQSLNSFQGFHFFEDERIKDGEDVFAVGENSFDARLHPWFVAGFAFPAFEDLRRDVDILPKLLQRVAAQEETIKERRFVLWFSELTLEQKDHTHLDVMTALLDVKRNRQTQTRNKDISLTRCQAL